MVDFKNALEKLHFNMSHVKCPRCDKVAYVPYIPCKDWGKLKIVAYVLYVHSYLHYNYGWHILKDNKNSHVCHDCYCGEDEYKSFSKELADKGDNYKIE